MNKLQLFDIPVFMHHFKQKHLGTENKHVLDGTAYTAYLALNAMNKLELKTRLIEVAKYGTVDLTREHIAELVEADWLDDLYQQIQEVKKLGLTLKQ